MTNFHKFYSKNLEIFAVLISCYQVKIVLKEHYVLMIREVNHAKKTHGLGT